MIDSRHYRKLVNPKHRFSDETRWVVCCRVYNRFELVENRPNECQICERRLENIKYFYTCSGEYRICESCVDLHYNVIAENPNGGNDEFKLTPKFPVNS